MSAAGDIAPDEGSPAIPLGNREPSELADFLFDDFVTAWNAMATCSPNRRVGGNFMFARQAFAYLELASRTAAADPSGWYLSNFSSRIADCDARYFTALPGPVPVPSSGDFSLPAAAERPAGMQLLAALFDTGRHGLAHLSQQIPVRLTDGKIWMSSFTGVRPGRLTGEALSADRREGHLCFTVTRGGNVYLIVRPDVLLADLRFSARLAAVFSQYLAPAYLQRPRPSGLRRGRPADARPAQPYEFTSTELIGALEAGGHQRLEPGAY